MIKPSNNKREKIKKRTKNHMKKLKRKGDMDEIISEIFLNKKKEEERKYKQNCYRNFS